MKKTLEADGIQFGYTERMILSDIYIRCEFCTITGILGRNGSGKSTLFEIIYGIRGETKSIRIGALHMKAAYRYPDRIRYLPQFHFIPGFLKVKRIFNDFYVSYDDFHHCFRDTSLRPESRMGDLSGGERRLVEIFVIAGCQSDFALLDEPFSHLSPLQTEEVIRLLQFKKQQKGFILTDHLYNHVLEISDTVYVLSDGKTYAVNKADDLRRLGYVQ